ncbi:MAG TPA: alpha,alpha-trehalose-phosphate synthase (UDP-forming) [Caulobacteraceae bacterium]|nr:alpha,alpha-trehalose-phosphate synthase (UDP-forming) [Caulobacteraceae bacterium]
MSRLVVVSNRVSVPRDQGEGTTGGLAMALSAALREHHGVWFGWSGETTEEFTGEISTVKVSGVTVATIDLDAHDVEEYYNGYANSVLWPLFHYRTDLTGYERAFRDGYERANVRFADALARLLREDDLVWIHDYHLIPLARELRRRGFANRIGFFLHIPWPARRLLTTLPGHSDLVEALLHYDLIGFQTEDHRAAFEEYITQEAGGEASADGRVARAYGLQSRLAAFPIGLDTEDFGKAARGPVAQAAYERMRLSRLGRDMIVGVDRLDYSKGLEERFLGYEQFLADNPDLHERVFMLQIATPSREQVEAYQAIRARLDGVSGRINGAYSTIDWVPVRYVNRAYRRDELAGVYRAARVGLITPLRDGMNLVAKEYVAAQEPDDPGVLILSQFAGAAEQMTEALIVNPLDREEMAEAIRMALSMPLPERRERWRSLMDGIERDDVVAWRDAFTAALADEPRAPADGDGARFLQAGI